MQENVLPQAFAPASNIGYHYNAFGHCQTDPILMTCFHKWMLFQYRTIQVHHLFYCKMYKLSIDSIVRLLLCNWFHKKKTYLITGMQHYVFIFIDVFFLVTKGCPIYSVCCGHQIGLIYFIQYFQLVFLWNAFGRPTGVFRGRFTWYLNGILEFCICLVMT